MRDIKVNIEQIDIANLVELQNVGRRTFYETYSNENTEEDMDKYLAENFSIELLSNELCNPSSEFYLARIEKEVVGYLKLNFGQAQTGKDNHDGVEIERIYVLKQYHGKKVGQVLYSKAMEIAKRRNSRYVWLGVWEKNPRAIRFYEKNGFIEYDKHVFVLGNDKQTDLMMKLKI